MLIRAFSQGDEDAVIGLWLECGLTRPWLGFYKSIGDLQDEAVSLGKRLIPDQPTHK